MKAILRRHFLETRRSLSQERRNEAQQQLLTYLIARSRTFERIASFYSMKDEIDLFSFNHKIAQEKRLLLPKVTDNGLDFYLVADPEKQMSPQGHYLFEPDPYLCEKTLLGSKDLLLVPGIAFDANRGRLGFGKGHYDRLLSRYPTILSIGIGFKEQLCSSPLPLDPWDQPVTELRLF